MTIIEALNSFTLALMNNGVDTDIKLILPKSAYLLLISELSSLKVYPAFREQYNDDLIMNLPTGKVIISPELK